MRISSLFSIVLFVIFLSISTFAQNSSPTPPIVNETDVVKISTTLIQVDATVTDKNGNVVRDLKPEDFEIYENGKKQPITNFSFISAEPQNNSSESVTLKSMPTGKNAILLPPAKLKPEQVRRTYAMVVDDLGLSFAGANYAKYTLKKFVNEQMQNGDLVAIIRLGSGLGALQSFTSDKRQILAAVEKIRWNAMSRTGVHSYEPLQKSLLDDLGTDKDHPERAQMGDQERNFLFAAQSQRQNNLALGSLGAMNYIIRGMSELPGRKSLMLFSEGVTLLDYSDITAGRGSIPKTSKTLDALKSLTAAANRSSVVIYTFDPRGIYVPGIEAIDNVGAKGAPSLGRFDAKMMREMQVNDSKDSLKILAEETGGLAYVNLNRMEQGVKKALEDQNSYYLIGYQPDEETFDIKKSRFNKLEIKVKRPDLKVRYRSGFFGITDEKLKENTKQNLSPVQKINAALASPFGAKDIDVDLYSIFYNDEKDKNFIRSFLRIDAKDLSFKRNDKGKYQAIINIAAMTFGDNGMPVDQALMGYTIELDENGYQKTLRQGFVYNFLLPVKRPGAYQFRIALLDKSSDKIGSASQFIEVPDTNKKRLTLSSVLLRNYSVDAWKKLVAGQNNSTPTDSNIFLDTTAREFKRGTVLNYFYEIYNAKSANGGKSQLQSQFRLFRNEKVVLQGKTIPVETNGQINMQKLVVSNAIVLGTDLQPGDYILQLLVTDNQSNGKNQIVSQAIDFEIVE